MTPNGWSAWQWLRAAAGLAIAVLAAPRALANDFDGSRDLLCAPSEAMACTPNEGCDFIRVEAIGLPRFLRLEFGKKRLVAVGGDERSSPIDRVRKDEGITVVQGSQGDRAWSLILDQASGLISASIVEIGGGFSIFGACTPAN